MPIYKGDTPIVEASGRKGKDGATYTPSISEEGILSWTNDKDLPNPEPINVKGQDGLSYTLTKSEDGTKIILTGSDGSVQEIPDSNTTYSEATQTESGLMSKEDKIKLDGMSSGGGGDELKFNVEETILYDGVADKYFPTVSLSDNIFNYDLIKVCPETVYYNSSTWSSVLSPYCFFPNTKTDNGSTIEFDTLKRVCIVGGSTIYSSDTVKFEVKTNSTSTSDLTGSYTISRYTSSFYKFKVYGYKFKAVKQ